MKSAGTLDSRTQSSQELQGWVYSCSPVAGEVSQATAARGWTLHRRARPLEYRHQAPIR